MTHYVNWWKGVSRTGRYSRATIGADQDRLSRTLAEYVRRAPVIPERNR